MRKFSKANTIPSWAVSVVVGGSGLPSKENFFYVVAVLCKKNLYSKNQLDSIGRIDAGPQYANVTDSNTGKISYKISRSINTVS